MGPFYDRERAEELRRERGYVFVEVGMQGLRRVVPSPAPREIVEVRAIRACLDEGLVVIAAGGGGVPVFGDLEVTKGVEAVIDKVIVTDSTHLVKAIEGQAGTRIGPGSRGLLH